MEWNAHWIWLKNARQTPNCYIYARKKFMLDTVCDSAELHITAYTDYILYINGRYAGRGPSPSNGKVFTYDTWNIAKYLSVRNNVIAVLAHNYGVGVHWNPAGPGGLIAQASMRCGGRTVELATDETWKVKTAECYDYRAPRMMFSCRFTEIYHMNQAVETWNRVDFDDSQWFMPEVIGRTPIFPYERLLPRPIPILREELVNAVSAEKARYSVVGFHAVNFSQIEEKGSNSIYYGTAYFYSERSRELTLLISCDDAYLAFLNGHMVLEQSYNEDFMRKSLFWGREDYEQIHDGIGFRRESVKVLLQKGWNRLTVAVDQGPRGWGFAAGFHDGTSVDDRTDGRYAQCRQAIPPAG